MSKVLSQLLSFLNYRPCTAMDSRSTHTMETLMYNVQCTYDILQYFNFWKNF